MKQIHSERRLAELREKAETRFTGPVGMGTYLRTDQSKITLAFNAAGINHEWRGWATDFTSLCVRSEDRRQAEAVIEKIF